MKRNRIGAALLAGALALSAQGFASAAAADDADSVAQEAASGYRADLPARPARAEAAAMTDTQAAEEETAVASVRPGDSPVAIDVTPSKKKKAKFRSHGAEKQTAEDADLAARYVESQDIFEVASLRRAATTASYRLFRGDSVSIVTIGFPNGIGIQGFTVGIDGYVQLPYVGSVKMEGRTLDEARDIIMQALGTYLKIPDMSLLITSYGPRKVYVMGEVNNPGIQNMSMDNMNAYAALASAGSWTRYGRSTKIQILRVEDGIMYYRTLNMKAFAAHHDLTQNVLLEDGDILYVPKTNGIKFSDILPYFSAWTMYKAIVSD